MAGDDVMGLEFFKKSQFNKCVEYIFATVCVATLIGPVYLFSVIGEHNQNSVILGCAAMFTLFMLSTTAAKRHEIFALTFLWVHHSSKLLTTADITRYCAVLMVFASQGFGGNRK